MRSLLLALLIVAVPQAAAQSRVSERTAFQISLWATVVPVATGAVMWASQKSSTPGDPFSGADRSGPSLVMAGGFVLGPSFGYSAAGLGGRGWRGVGIRSGLTLLSFLPAFAICGWDCSKGDEAYDVAWVVVATGAGLSAASAVYDIARVKHNVRRRRAATGSSAGAEFSISPTYTPGRRAVGVHVSILL